MRISIPASFDLRELGDVGLSCRGERWASPRAVRGFDKASPNGENRLIANGFTLIELMVVLTIIGFISAAVMLAMPDPRGRVVEDADRFAARVAAARDEAVVTARPMGVWVSASGYGFQRRDGGQWVPLEDKPFVTANWKSGTRALVGKDGRQQIGFDGTGLPTDAMTVTLAREAERISVTVDMAGKVRVGG